MQDIDALRSRVETTSRRMVEAQSERMERNQSLLEILARLEKKYAAQQEELSFFQARIGPLEQANAQLSGLMTRLLDMVDAGIGEDSLAPVRRASAMAAAMLENDLVIPPGTPAVDDEPAERAEAEMPQPWYEDVDPETLARDQAMEQCDPGSLPEIVRRSLAEPPRDGGRAEPQPAFPDEARHDGGYGIVLAPPAHAAGRVAPSSDTVETVEALAGALGRKTGAGEPLVEDDIRALLSRVEALAQQKTVLGDDIDIPPTEEEDEFALFATGQEPHKTGTVG